MRKFLMAAAAITLMTMTTVLTSCTSNETPRVTPRTTAPSWETGTLTSLTKPVSQSGGPLIR